MRGEKPIIEQLYERNGEYQYVLHSIVLEVPVLASIVLEVPVRTSIVLNEL